LHRAKAHLVAGAHVWPRRELAVGRFVGFVLNSPAQHVALYTIWQNYIRINSKARQKTKAYSSGLQGFAIDVQANQEVAHSQLDLPPVRFGHDVDRKLLRLHRVARLGHLDAEIDRLEAHVFIEVIRHNSAQNT
jgi:hypothetical protein